MTVATLLVFLVSQQGYWQAGQEQAVDVQWVAKAGMPPADLIWELNFGTLKLDGGTVPLAAADGVTRVTVKAPDVRVRVPMRWTYRVVERPGGKVLEGGELAVHVFPADITSDYAKRIGTKRVVVWDDAGGMTEMLKAAKVPFTRVDDLSNVMDRPDVILVGPDRLDASPFSGAPLLNFARAGSSVAVLEQRRPTRVGDYALGERERPAELRFRADHPLFDRLDLADLRSWTAARGDGAAGASSLRPLQLPADEPALELAWWPGEAGGHRPRPIDALVVTKSIGAGRIVLCQLPLGRPDRDPRSQLFVGNLLSYLTTRPEPTPPPGERGETPAKVPEPAPKIDVP